MRVKGTMVLDFVRIIRANKDKNWDKWLQKEDWYIINARIMPSSWYPYDFFKRIGLSVFKEMADSNLDAARMFGRFSIANQLKVYQNLVVKGDPLASVKKLAGLKKSIFKEDDEVNTAIVDYGENWLSYCVTKPSMENDNECIEAITHQFAGYVEEIIEQSGSEVTDVSVSKDLNNYYIKTSWL